LYAASLSSAVSGAMMALMLATDNVLGLALPLEDFASAGHFLLYLFSRRQLFENFVRLIRYVEDSLLESLLETMEEAFRFRLLARAGL